MYRVGQKSKNNLKFKYLSTIDLFLKFNFRLLKCYPWLLIMEKFKAEQLVKLIKFYIENK